jgi:hypothetical protein
MNVTIAVQFLFWKYINRIFAVDVRNQNSWFYIIHAAAFLDTHLAISNYFHEIYRDICNSNIKDILCNKKN